MQAGLRKHISMRILAVCLGIGICAAGICAGQAPVFTSPTTYISNGASITGPSTYWSGAADFNRDGRLDFVAADNRVADNINGFVAVISSAGAYSAPISHPVGFYVSNLRPADFNNDGKADLLLCGTNNAIVLGNGDGTFSTPSYVPMPVGTVAGVNCTTADLDNDGNQDILTPGAGGLAVARGNGDGTFRPAVRYSTTFDLVYVVTGDFNNDGLVDALGAVNSVSAAIVFPGNGDGTFGSPIQTMPIPFGAQAGDFNSDGKLDLVYMTSSARQEGSNFAITIALGTGDGGFIGYSSYVVQQAFRGLAVRDFNGDGKLDVATYMSGNSTLTVFTGQGNGTLGPVMYQYPLPASSYTLLGADIDRNGSDDLVVSSYSQYTVFRNGRGNPPLLTQLSLNPGSVVGGANSTATVTLGGPAPAGGTTVAIATSDVNTVVLSPTVKIAEGATTGSFTITTRTVAAPSASTISVSSGDVTLTAKLDIVQPFRLTGLTISPATQYSNLTSTGTIILSGPAASSTTVSLTSSNPAAVVPAAVTIPAGSATGQFSVTLRQVAVNTSVTIGAAFDGVSQTAAMTVTPAGDTLRISRAEYAAKNRRLKIDATSTSANAEIAVYDAASGVQLGFLLNEGKGNYSATIAATLGANPSITLRSSLGGVVTGRVDAK